MFGILKENANIIIMDDGRGGWGGGVINILEENCNNQSIMITINQNIQMLLFFTTLKVSGMIERSR